MMLRRALAQSLRRSSTTPPEQKQQRPVVKQLLNAIRKTPWWAGGDVERNRTLFEELMERGKTNGVKNLRIVRKAELRRMEPEIHPDAIAALYSPDAGMRESRRIA